MKGKISFHPPLHLSKLKLLPLPDFPGLRHRCRQLRCTKNVWEIAEPFQRQYLHHGPASVAWNWKAFSTVSTSKSVVLCLPSCWV